MARGGTARHRGHRLRRAARALHAPLLDTDPQVWYKGGMKSETVKFRLGPDLKSTLEHHAYEQEMRLGEFIRYALSRYVDTHPTEPELREQAEAIKKELLGESD